MPYFLIEAAYKEGAARAMVAHPHNRAEVVEKACQSLGGHLHSLFFAFGDFDVVCIVELPTTRPRRRWRSASAPPARCRNIAQPC